MKTYVFSDEHNCDHTYVLAADAQATVEALQAIIKQMGEQAAILAKDGMAARAQVEALQRERNQWKEAFERSCDDTAHLRTALDAEREKRTALLAEIDEGLTLSDNLLAIQTVTALYDKLAQLQALVLGYKEAIDYYAKTAICARAVAALEKAATLDATTPAGGGQ